jgi:hypothetical protein
MLVGHPPDLLRHRIIWVRAIANQGTDCASLLPFYDAELSHRGLPKSKGAA